MRRILVAAAAFALLALVAAFAYQHYLRPPPALPPDSAELDALRQERRALRQRLRTLTNADAGLAKVPRGSLLIGLPATVTQKLLEQAVASLFTEVRITLRDLSVHMRKADVIRAKTAQGTLALGEYQLDLQVREVQGVLDPGAPRVSFGGPSVGLVMPLALTAGRGRATLRLQWNGRGEAGATCSALDLKRSLKGDVVPLPTLMRGEFRLSAEGNAVLATPRLRDVALKLRLELAPETWRTFDELIEAQSAVCRAALKKADVVEKLRDLIARGFVVTLPGALVRPIRMPAGVGRQVDLLGGGRATLAVKPIVPLAAPERLWYGAIVDVQRGGV